MSSKLKFRLLEVGCMLPALWEPC